ncbi:hypothetical protein DPMN_114124 [Dreissena polymorpha]|uniref:Uncharacterized protein n=1 Tax=Dreissena polymorpha TaxID=45954 RepID=A0A9D4KJG0_DREPO|nr:hypothetical protein DPMN_114124 [Dreissena polymorpha]
MPDPGSTGMNEALPGLTGAPPGTIGMNRGKPRLQWESIKMLNTSGMSQASPGRTGNDRRGTGNSRDGTGNNRDGTEAPPGPIPTPADLR